MNGGLVFGIMLLAILTLTAIKVLITLSNISIQMGNAYFTLNLLHNLLADFHDKSDHVIESIGETERHLSTLEEDIREIKYVIDIIRDYKLPDKSEREFLDRVAADQRPYE